jgi:hypothetical protein
MWIGHNQPVSKRLAAAVIVSFALAFPLAIAALPLLKQPGIRRLAELVSRVLSIFHHFEDKADPFFGLVTICWAVLLLAFLSFAKVVKEFKAGIDVSNNGQHGSRDDT